ncbi:MAG: EH signature domain-containing protein [Pseudomonadota bacterium]
MNSLHRQLSEAMAPNLVFRAPVWGNPRAMSEALRDVRNTLSGADAGLPDKNVLQQSLHRFASTQAVANFTELKHVCYGITVPLGDKKWSLIDREPLFHSLLELVERYGREAKQYRRCYQGLLNGYFGFEKQTASVEGQENWFRLRTYLDQKLTTVVQSAAQRDLPVDWLNTLSAHRNLLTDDPCSRYATGLRQGRADEFRSLCSTLGIASTSWVWDEALMAYVAAVCRGDDLHFQRDMPGVLDLVNGRSEIRLAQLLGTRATAMAVARYANCGDRPEHPDLRDTSLRCIGNPWVNRTAWDAHVRHESARQMVESWIKRRLIKDFFELMTHDGGADLRRLNYWLKREPEISDMWFVLGADARNNRSVAFEELRARMLGRRRSLDDPNPQNNAFVMRIGPLLVIEFGVTGNACYAFAASDFKADLDKPLLTIHVLKQRTGASRLSHGGSWESKFDYELRRMLQSVPSHKGELPARPPPAPIVRTPHAPAWSPDAAPRVEAPAGPGVMNAFQTVKIIAACKQHGVLWEDNRPKQGAFWVLMQSRSQHVGFAALLETHGFAYAPGKGFWIK